MTLEEALAKYEVVIGLEIHAQLNTKGKAYCNDINEYGSTPNTNVSPITLGHPGTLPKFNKAVIVDAIKLGLACNSDITRVMHFDRKNYFYPDLPKGYQITQDKTPICTGGFVEIKDDKGNSKQVELTRIHCEEDAGKSIHDVDPFDTLVDLNRAGVPLLEIVTEPVIKSATEAYNYVTEVRKLVRYLEICDGNMEEGSMRCDVNISIMPIGTTEFGNRVEVKNMNSIRNVHRAIEHEIVRHAEIIEAGGQVHTDTRNFIATTGTTVSIRTKEAAHDYRYFPEPDLGPVTVSQEQIDDVASKMPPLPNYLLKKYMHEFGLSEYDASNLTEQKGIAMYFEEIIAHTLNKKAAANWLMGSVKSYLNQNALDIAEFSLPGKKIAELIQIIDEGKVINSAASQHIFPALVEAPEKSPLQIAEEKQLLTQSDSNELEIVIKKIFADNPSETERFKNGEKKLTGFFMGQVMRAMKGAAEPKKTTELINKLIEE